MRCIYKTFEHAGYNVAIHPTGSNPDQRNLLFFASFSRITLDIYYISEKDIDISDAIVLEDEYPVLDYINKEAAHRWRTLAINSFLNDMNQKALPVFK